MRHWMKSSCTSAFVHYCLVSSRSKSRIGTIKSHSLIMPPKRSIVQMSSSSSSSTSMSSSSSSSTEGIMMILSPAKTLDLSPFVPPGDNDKDDKDDGKHNLSCSVPDCNPSQTQQVVTAMKKRKESDLKKLLGISPKLAKTAHEYWTNFDNNSSTLHQNNIQKPAIYAFSGAAYQGLESSTCSPEMIQYLQHNLRIIDPLYGALRPLDMIQPYRLEMATKHVFSSSPKEKLADWWKSSVTAHLAKDLSLRKKDKVLLNLASDEYSAAVDSTLLEKETGGGGGGCAYIKIVFWEQGRTIAVHAKRARGLMVRYLAEHHIQTLEGIQSFDVEGYSFQPLQSNESTFVFDRTKQPPKKKTAATTTTTTTTTNKKSSGTKKRSRTSN